jgi:hypothetical protein
VVVVVGSVVVVVVVGSVVVVVGSVVVVVVGSVVVVGVPGGGGVGSEPQRFSHCETWTETLLKVAMDRSRPNAEATPKLEKSGS